MTFVDANVVLEVILKRQRSAACETYLGNKEDKAISILTLDLVMYFAQRDKLQWQAIKAFLESFAWLPIVDADAQWAFAHFDGDDFEDALQVACAVREDCDKFVTLDVSLSKKYAKDIRLDLIR